MSMETGRTDLIFAGRASHAGTPCPNNACDPITLATAPVPIPNFMKSRRPRVCRSVLFMSHSLKVPFVYYSSLDGSKGILLRVYATLTEDNPNENKNYYCDSCVDVC